MSSEVIFSVKKLSKRYEIYSKPVDRLWQMIWAGRKQFYREFWALKDVSFEICRGESVGIVGRNGAGKSTLLKLLTGTLQKTSGSFYVKTGLRVAALLELGSGFNPEFTGRENVYLNASILGLSRKDTDRRYQEIIDFADIGDFIDQPVKKYSSGMKVRLAFAVQIIVSPDILIVDEALSVGDMFFQQKCMHRMRKLQESGCTLLFVSHSLAAVRSLCSRAIYLEQGRVKMEGVAKEVCDAYAMSLVEGVSYGGATADKAVMSATRTLVTTSPVNSIPFRIDSNFSKRLTERKGSGDIRYVAAGFYDESGKPIQVAESGQIVRLAVSFQVLKDVPPGAIVGFGCRDKFGVQLISMNLHTFDQALPAMKAGSNRTMEYTLRIPLNAGQYFWSFGAQWNPDENQFYDYCLGAVALTVVKNESQYSRYQWGMFLMSPCRITFSGEGNSVLLYEESNAHE